MTEPGIVVFAYHDVGYECLDVLIQRGCRILAVFTHKDRSEENIWFKSVADLAQRHRIPVHTPESVNTPEWIERLRALKPAIIFSFYYRHMIGQEILDIASLGAFNMHGSLLPKYRGRVPINWAVLHGETEIGATLHYMVKRPDAGDIVDQQAVTIGARETAQDVFVKVTAAARKILEKNLDVILQGRAPRHPQDEAQASYFGGRKPQDGRVDWRQDARQIFNFIRALTHPYPGAFSDVEGKQLLIWWAEPRMDKTGIAGQVISLTPLCVAAGQGSLEITRWQWQGKSEQANGTHGLRLNQILGAAGSQAISV